MLIKAGTDLPFLPDIQKIMVTYLSYLIALYILSFLLFAIIRVLTGLSIKRLGYFSLRYISFSPKHGIQVTIDRLGLSLHRNTVARPGWLSLYMNNLEVTVDPMIALHPDFDLFSKPSKHREEDKQEEESFEIEEEDGESFKPPKTTFFKLLRWILVYARFFDVSSVGTSVTYTGIGSIIAGNLTFKVDLRKKSLTQLKGEKLIGTLDNYQFKLDEIPALCRILGQDFYVIDGPDEENNREFLDYVGLDVHGVLGKEDLSVKDLSLAFKLGKPIIHTDKLISILDKIRKVRKELELSAQQKSLDEMMDDDSDDVSISSNSSSVTSSSLSSWSKITQGVLSEKDLHNLTKIGTGLIRVVKEVELRAGYITLFGIPIPSTDPNECSKVTTFSASAKDVLIDLRRLNPRSPGFKLFFSEGETAHQSIVTMSSFSFGIDIDGSPDELVYIPMSTIISKTNFFSKSLQLVQQSDNVFSNLSLFRANINVTCPTVDLEAYHVPILLQAFGGGDGGGGSSSSRGTSSTSRSKISASAQSFQRLWPKATIAFTIDEPAARLLTSSKAPESQERLSRGMVISSTSKIHCDFESSHSDTQDQPNYYTLNASFQMSSYDTWYRTESGERFDVFLSENLAVKVGGTMNPLPNVKINISLSNAHFLLTKYEVFNGLKELVSHSRNNRRKRERPLSSHKENSPCFLRELPPWLTLVTVEIADTTVSIAADQHELGMDIARGMTIKMGNSAIKYKVGSRNDTDRRKLVTSMEGIEAYQIIEPYGLLQTESNKIVDIPSLNVTLFTEATDEGPLLQSNIVLKQAVLNYDLSSHFLALMVADLLRQTVQGRSKPVDVPKTTDRIDGINYSVSDFIGINVKTGNIRFEIALPNSSRLMLETNSLDLQRVRHVNPRARANMVRLYSNHPTIANAWGRLITLRSFHGEIKKTTDVNEVKDEDILLSFDGMRLNVPNQFIFHSVLDSAVTLFKAADKMQQDFESKQFLKETEHMPTTHPRERNKMPNIPKVRIQSSSLLISLEDDHFESQLGLIFQVGLKEQKLRLEKERAFDAKVDAISTSKKTGRCVSSSTRSMPTRKGSPPTEETNGRLSTEIERKRSPVEEDTVEFEMPNGTHRPKKHVYPLKQFNLHRKKRGSNVKYVLTECQRPSDESKVSIETARNKLRENFSKSWIRGFNRAHNAQKEAVQENINNIWGFDEIDSDTTGSERIVEYSQDPLLFYSMFNNVDLLLSKPSFNDDGLRHYLYNIGKGLPLDTRFTLLIPLAIDLSLSEWRIQVRDYPLPMLHFPQLHHSQDPSIASVKLQGNLVLAEELCRDESGIRNIIVPLVPSANLNRHNPEMQKYIYDVHRTVAPVKMYTDLNFVINTMNPTRLTWSSCLQPAIQTVMLGFDSFTKPPIDPSIKLGFWDKIRCIFHSRIFFKWTLGDMHLQFKGSRSPYELLGDGEGFVMAWRNNVTLSINPSDDPKDLMIADSDEYILAVPNYVAMERDYFQKANTFSHALLNNTNFSEMTNFRKVVMKLSGNVRWKVGLLFEQDRVQGRIKERTSEFRPHYDIHLKKPEFVEDLDSYDAYERFRSKYLHLAISVSSPNNHQISNRENAFSYNTVHLTPKFMYHFRKWWALFDGSLSLPIKNGPLFQPTLLKKPKFGRHLFTVKYQLVLSPLFIAHTYQHPHGDDYAKRNAKLACTGLKGKVDKFVMDLHQRREQEEDGKRWRMKLHRAELDLEGTDLRMILATFKEQQEMISSRKFGHSYEPSVGSSTADGSNPTSANLTGKYKISDNDFSWIDMDDYTEIDKTISSRTVPKIVVLPLLSTPRWTYFRQTDHSRSNIARTCDGEEFLKFGSEPIHDCLIGQSHPEITQTILLQQRIEEIEEQIKTYDATLDSLVKDLDQFPNEPRIAQRLLNIKQDIECLNTRKEVIMEALGECVTSGRCVLPTKKSTSNEHLEAPERQDPSRKSFSALEEIVDPNNENDFNNRFIIHHAQLKWNNSVRNAVYRYMHKVGDRRAFSYFVTRKAVKYIEDFIKSQLEEADVRASSENRSGSTPRTNSVSGSSRQDLQQLLGDVMSLDQEPNGRTKSNNKVVDHSSDSRMQRFEEELRVTRRNSQQAQDAYLVRFTSPQIQLVSDQNADQCVLVTSRNIELKIIDVVDKQEEKDKVSGLVESRYGVMLQDAQFFVLSKDEVAQGSVALFSNNSYGCGQLVSWPPWLTVECCYDSSPLKSALVVEQTSATLRYDKPNSIRVQDSSLSSHSSATDLEGSREEFCANAVRCERYRANRIAVDFPKVFATCDSQQYFAVYTIVVDLLVYSEPSHKKTTDRLEEVLLATDFSDLNGALERLKELQSEIRQLVELRNEFAIRMQELDNSAMNDLNNIEVELQHVSLELVVMMKAVKTGIQKGHHRDDKSSLIKWAIASDQIVWHALSEHRTPFLDIGLADASFNRIESGDGYNSNTVEIGMMQAFNLLPNALYPELISPYFEDGVTNIRPGMKLLSAKWTMLDPIGGIPIMENFEVKLLPLKLQLERDSGQKIFDYIFPANKDGHNESPFVVSRFGKKEGIDMDDDDDDDDEHKMLDGTDKNASSSDSSDYTSLYDNDYDSILTSSAARQGRIYSHRKEMSDSLHPSSTRGSSSSIYGSRMKYYAATAAAASIQSERDLSPSRSNVSLASRNDSSRSSQNNTSFESSVNNISSTLGNHHRPTKNKHNTVGKNNSHRVRTASSNTKDSSQKDELATMVNRASNYMSIVDIKIHPTTLCVSYKVGIQLTPGKKFPCCLTLCLLVFFCRALVQGT